MKQDNCDGCGKVIHGGYVDGDMFVCWDCYLVLNKQMRGSSHEVKAVVDSNRGSNPRPRKIVKKEAKK